ncbi:MAG: ABC transporter ATP-binding protein [Rhodocyclaceae bacterium]|nr:ABC transporter ATP-binding protein [Rhodocyclaceae bacterium]MCA3091669.1 ABC transporter ATP-binding protein [Rhodocyclaceae bacterium]MCA3093437.1 ABC transporter ATP-binding protein [Rhodocyclaceae bacterium]MCA3096254.1 ABC transporter ATP-binding protein [Rhodocyclaceae bacterium]MCA3101299.1 ABC transporter ATP-binding protein [Rhodocyclaceae bacterium]
MATLLQALFGKSLKKVDEYPVLHGIDLEIRRGETVGIMGRNGAGKTTLLGILGNVIQATSGNVERFGRIATLLGLTAGFNANFSGRENAYLFCSMQGISRAETDKRIGAIEAFADLGRFFDRPLRTYSSGMQSRLAFSCAIHVDCDLIIIDETLAVGDANFRMKCYDRIRHMKESGQTFLLVSHNPNMLANFCTRGVILEGGQKVFDGPTFEAVEAYKRIRTEAMGEDDFEGKIVGSTKPDSTLSNDAVLDGFQISERREGDRVLGVVRAHLCARRNIKYLALNFGITNQHGITVCALDGSRAGFNIGELNAGDSRPVELSFERKLAPGRYFVSCIVHELIGDVKRPLSLYQNFVYFDIPGNSATSGIADLGMAIRVL